MWKKYSLGAYNVDHPVIKMFWKVVESFTNKQKRQLLKFVTSCSRPPLLGFKVNMCQWRVHLYAHLEWRVHLYAHLECPPTAVTCQSKTAAYSIRFHVVLIIYFLVLWAKGLIDLWHHFACTISSHISETVEDLFSKIYVSYGLILRPHRVLYGLKMYRFSVFQFFFSKTVL